MLKRSWRWKSRVRSRVVAGARGRQFTEKIQTVSLFRPDWPWMPSFRVGGAFSALGPGRLTASLVVVALLFCHGAFGYAHQLPPVDVQTAPVAHAAGVHQSPGSDQSAEGLHLGDTYFATLLLLLFGTSLLLGAGVSVGAKLPAPTLRMGGHEARELPPPRGPTLSHLQVFRL